jgi:hypothetical protein
MVVLRIIFFVCNLPAYILETTLHHSGGHFLLRLPIYIIWHFVMATSSFIFAHVGIYFLAIPLAFCAMFADIGDIIWDFGDHFSKISLKRRLNIFGLIRGEIIFILSFAAIYYSLSCMFPTIVNERNEISGAFNQDLSIIDSIYFSVITATTVGYGDISPKNNTAKLASLLEALIGFFIVSILIAGFVSIWIVQQMDKNDSDGNENPRRRA